MLKQAMLSCCRSACFAGGNETASLNLASQLAAQFNQWDGPAGSVDLLIKRGVGRD